MSKYYKITSTVVSYIEADNKEDAYEKQEEEDFIVNETSISKCEEISKSDLMKVLVL